MATTSKHFWRHFDLYFWKPAKLSLVTKSRKYRKGKTLVLFNFCLEYNLNTDGLFSSRFDVDFVSFKSQGNKYLKYSTVSTC